MDTERTIAVLTGDIVDSSGLQRVALGPVSALIESAGQGVKDRFQTAVYGEIDVFRGDSWQLVVLQPAIAVRIGLYLRASLRASYGMDSRVSVGYGPVTYLPSDNISTGSGQAFTLSGQGLEDCRKPDRMKVSFALDEQALEIQGIQTIVQLIDLQAGRWTAGQSQAVAGALLQLTQAQIAANWEPKSISQQAISQHLDNAGWIQIDRALEYLEGALPLILTG